MRLNELFNTFADNILPILLISGAGFLLGKMIQIDSRSLGRVVFYIFSPILVFNMLLQIFEDGHLSDAKGRRVDFRNCIIIMTSNLGARQLQTNSSLGFRLVGDSDAERQTASPQRGRRRGGVDGPQATAASAPDDGGWASSTRFRPRDFAR